MAAILLDDALRQRAAKPGRSYRNTVLKKSPERKKNRKTAVKKSVRAISGRLKHRITVHASGGRSRPGRTFFLKTAPAQSVFR